MRWMATCGTEVRHDTRRAECWLIDKESWRAVGFIWRDIGTLTTAITAIPESDVLTEPLLPEFGSPINPPTNCAGTTHLTVA